MSDKRIVLVAGPNGAGKTTIALTYSSEYKLPYLGADQIAEEISPGHWDKVHIQAGRLFIQRLREGIDHGTSMVIESTLSGQSMRRLIREAKDRGYLITIVYVFLETVDHCVGRVLERVQKGGHDVPENDIRRRYGRSKNNFWSIYRYDADQWYLLDNSGELPREVAIGECAGFEIVDEVLYNQFVLDIEG